MIAIKVNDKSLVLYRDTSLHLELNNTLFSSDTIDGDVVYTFEIPVHGNEEALSFSHNPHALRGQRYDCTIDVAGVNMLSGTLMVQKVDINSIEVGVICNDFPKGWPEKSVRNDIDEIVDILPEHGSMETHKALWKNFLTRTLPSDSDIKFGLVRNEENYGNDNENFGFWNGSHVSPLVNRLFVSGGHIVENTDKPFIHLFNTLHFFGEELEMNQFAFCPQLRLRTVVRKIFMSAGYRVKGDFFEDSDISKIYLQSPVALDGDMSQYSESQSAHAEWTPAEDDPRFAHNIYVFRSVHGHWKYDKTRNSEWWNGTFPPELTGMIEQYAFRRIPLQWVTGETAVTNTFFQPTVQGTYRLSFSIRIPRFMSPNTVRTMPGAVLLCTGDPTYLTDDSVVAKREYSNLLDVTEPLTGEFRLSVTNSNIASGTGYSFKVAYIADDNVVCSVPPGRSSVDISLIENGATPGLNIFARSFSLGKCLPNISNSKFLNAIRKAFGLAFYIDKDAQMVEVSTASKVAKAGSLDLSDYVLDRETVITVKPEMCIFSYGTMESPTDLDPSQILPAVRSISDLPSAAENINKYCYVTQTNAYWHSEKVEDETTSWRYEWKKAFGNNISLKYGNPDGDENNLSTDAIVPTLFEYGMNDPSGTRAFIPDIPFKIESTMFGDEKGSDIILLYYRGRERYIYRNGQRIYEYENMAPVVDSGFSLKTEGDNSSGDRFIRPWLQIVSSSDIFKYTFRLPFLKMLEVMELMRPSFDGSSVRWLIVNNVRTMPRKVTMEVSNTNNNILCEIEAVRPNLV